MNNILIDGFMIVLLLMAIVFCWRLNKRLQGMKQIGGDLQPFLRHFSTYIGKISQQIDTLREAADQGHNGLSEKIPRAASLKDDLDILLEHSEKISTRLDILIGKAQQIEKRLHQTVELATRGRYQPLSSPTTHGYGEQDSVQPIHHQPEQEPQVHSFVRDFPIDRNLLSTLRGLR
ncbi:MAG: hypothetical protein NTX76_06035 [Alphaproteobacteria bacterium]|nr:hypothetical protein [Alphaproteobacteria bacterium]